MQVILKGTSGNQNDANDLKCQMQFLNVVILWNWVEFYQGKKNLDF